MTLSSSQSPRRKFVPSIWLATALIGLYQRYISPYKGFRCAHRVLHNSRSCSSYAKFMIQQQGILGARPHIRQRFADCSAAARILHSQANINDPDRRKRRRDNAIDCCCDGVELPILDCDLGGCGWGDRAPYNDCGLDDCGVDGCETPDCGDCGDCSDCGDCGDCDVGGCDGCDVGGCG